eukprot:360203-Chlamydomonas_euryale.AAC.3
MAVAAAARPTSEWNAATICGSSVMLIRVASARPARPPAPRHAKIWTYVGTSTSSDASAAATPSPTPTRPSALPVRADDCEGTNKKEKWQVEVIELLDTAGICRGQATIYLLFQNSDLDLTQI